ncbi:MAG TPA: hypothetical protein VIL55_15370, partial [Naasia sp.]
MSLSVLSASEDGRIVLAVGRSGVSVELSAPRLELLSGRSLEVRATTVRRERDAVEIEWSGMADDVRATVRDEWDLARDQLTRRAAVTGPSAEGVRMETSLCAPGAEGARF